MLLLDTTNEEKPAPLQAPKHTLASPRNLPMNSRYEDDHSRDNAPRRKGYSVKPVYSSMEFNDRSI